MRRAKPNYQNGTVWALCLLLLASLSVTMGGCELSCNSDDASDDIRDVVDEIGDEIEDVADEIEDKDRR